MPSTSLLRHRPVPVPRPGPERPHRRAGATVLGRGVRWLLMALMLSLSAALVFWAPAAAGTGWVEVWHILQKVGPAWLLGLTAVWIAGLSCYAVVMTAALPGLNTRQALSLNLAGSAVANSLPLGGAVSLGLVTAMSRSWGFARSPVTTFLILTNLWNVLIRVLFGALSIAWLLTAGPGLVTGAAAPIIAVLAVGLVLAVAAVLISPAALAWIGRGASTFATNIRHRCTGSAALPEVPDHAPALLAMRLHLLCLLRTSWLRLTLGMLGYIVLLALLLDLCLRALGTSGSVWLMLAVVGIERLVTALPITPGGAGAAELSLVACLTAAGIPGVDAVAAALLYRFFTFIAEFPVGAAVALGWRLSQSRRIAHPGRSGGLPRIEPSA